MNLLSNYLIQVYIPCFINSGNVHTWPVMLEGYLLCNKKDERDDIACVSYFILTIIINKESLEFLNKIYALKLGLNLSIL